MTPYYALPDGFFYVDTTGAQQYEAATGTEIVKRVTVSASCGDALDAWIQSIWLTGAETLVAGEGRALVGQERLMVALGIKEKLLSAGLPTNGSESDTQAVASILYVVTDPGRVPLAQKLALVRFLHVSEETTEIVWSIKITPTVHGDAATLAGLVDKMLARGIALLVASIEAARL